MSRDITKDERELLKFNYEKIHQSVWENHKISWTVTAIFLTAIFGFQTFIVKDYFSAEKRIWIQVLIAVSIIEGLVLIWVLIMQCFRSYNLIRFYRLRQIEEILSSNKICEDTYLMRQYNYDFRCFPKPLKKEIYGQCEGKDKIKDIPPIMEKFDFSHIYRSIKILIKYYKAILLKKTHFDFFDIYILVFLIISFLNLMLARAAYIYRS
ncbi:MAG: hypothetical protein NTU95_03280 [Methanothrix sp.]|nr:hypothetical protein [Methanothrix sp.]